MSQLFLIGSARVKVHSHPHDHAEYRPCHVGVTCPGNDGSITITIEDKALEDSGTADIRSLHMPLARKVWMKSHHHDHFVVVAEYGSAVVKICVSNITEQLRWALALKPGMVDICWLLPIEHRVMLYYCIRKYSLGRCICLPAPTLPIS